MACCGEASLGPPGLGALFFSSPTARAVGYFLCAPPGLTLSAEADPTDSLSVSDPRDMGSEKSGFVRFDLDLQVFEFSAWAQDD